MNRYNRHQLLIGLALALGLALPLASWAEKPLPKAQADLLAFAKDKGIPCYVRQCANGSQRVCMNVCTAKHIKDVQGYLKHGSNVLENVHFDPYHSPGESLMHTLAIFDRKGPHFQTPDGFVHWNLNDWGGGELYPSRHPMFSNLIQLDEAQANNLRGQIELAKDEQHVPPNYWIKTAFGLGRGGGNCASIWCDAPIGANGEKLHQIVGIGGGNGNPWGLQSAIEDNGNDKVFGTIVYGPAVPNWGQNKNTGLFSSYINRQWQRP
jgi:hypothetical protein